MHEDKKTLAVFVGHSSGEREVRLLILARNRECPEALVIKLLGDSGELRHLLLRRQKGPRGLTKALAEAGIAVFLARFEALPESAATGPLGFEVSDPSGHLGTFAGAVRKNAARADECTFAFGSCLYGYHSEHSERLARVLGESAAEFLLMLGDNVYLDVHPQLGSADAAEHTAQIYSDVMLDNPGARRLLTTVPLLMAYDDHDFFDGFPHVQPHLARTWLPWTRKRFVRAARQGIDLLQAPLNPAPLVHNRHSYLFSAGPLDGFMLDIRCSRTNLDAESPRLTSEAELDAFERWASQLQRPGLLALGQPLSIDGGTWHEPNPPRFSAQFGRIVAALAGAPFDIAVLAGDLHVSQLLELDLYGRKVIEITSSPFTRIPSYARNMLRRILPVTEDQEPAAVKLVDPRSVGSPLGITDYIMGCSTPNSFAQVNAKQSGDGVEVRVEFVDPDRAGGAPCEPDDGLKLSPRIGVGASCVSQFRLGARP